MKKYDKQLTCMAGEYLAAGKLFKKGLQVAVTVGKAKAIDIFAYNEINDKNYNVQVKTLREKDGFFLKEKNINADHIFIFIVLNDFENDEDYFIVKGSKILNDVNKFFGSTYKSENPSEMSAIRYGALKEYKDNWNEFDN